MAPVRKLALLSASGVPEASLLARALADTLTLTISCIVDTATALCLTEETRPPVMKGSR